jgi:hypothetical protein
MLTRQVSAMQGDFADALKEIGDDAGVEAIVSALPLERSRRWRWRRSLTHDEHRLRQHFGYIDPKRVELCRLSIGAASWCSLFSGLFGEAALHYMPRHMAHVIKFPARRVKSGSSDGCC